MAPVVEELTIGDRTNQFPVGDDVSGVALPFPVEPSVATSLATCPHEAVSSSSGSLSPELGHFHFVPESLGEDRPIDPVDPHWLDIRHR